jgi:hypothetical protein
MRAFALLLSLSMGKALACGYCVEDKIASTYDHASVTRAVGIGHHVVFFHLDGAVPQQDAARRALVAAAESVPGVDRGSVRVALDTFTLSLAFDPRRTSLAALQGALDARLASRKLSAFPLRVIERAGELKEAAARKQ